MAKNIKKFNYQKIAEMYKIFSNPKRLELLFALVEEEKSFADLLKILKLKKSNLSQYVSLLRRMNFIEVRKEGKNIFCLVKNKKVVKMIKIFKELWEKGEISCT